MKLKFYECIAIYLINLPITKALTVHFTLWHMNALAAVTFYMNTGRFSPWSVEHYPSP